MALLEEPIKEILKLKNYINGEWVESESDQVLDIINPATQKTIAKVPMSTRDEVNTAIEAAREFQYSIECGNVGINIGIVAPMAFFPFSGTKDSFLGVLHGQGRDAIRFFTESKVVVQRWF